MEEKNHKADTQKKGYKEIIFF